MAHEENVLAMYLKDINKIPMISHEDFPFFAIGYTKSDNISVYSIFKLSILQLTILTSLQFLPVHFLQENLSEAV